MVCPRCQQPSADGVICEECEPFVDALPRCATLEAFHRGVQLVMMKADMMPERDCELCGIHTDCRRYGPEGEWVCYNCGMKNPEVAFDRSIIEAIEAANNTGEG